MGRVNWIQLVHRVHCGQTVSPTSEDVFPAHAELLDALGSDGVLHLLQRVVAALGAEHARGLPRDVAARVAAQHPAAQVGDAHAVRGVAVQVSIRKSKFWKP